MEKSVKETVKQVTDFVNSFSIDEKGFIEAMSSEHRTLQQSFTRLVLKWIEHCASDEYRHDLRNEASHKISKQLVDLFQKETKSLYPLHYKQMKPSSFLPFV